MVIKRDTAQTTEIINKYDIIKMAEKASVWELFKCHEDHIELDGLYDEAAFLKETYDILYFMLREFKPLG